MESDPGILKPGQSDLCIFVCVKRNTPRKIQGSAGLGGWHVPVIPERQVGEEWGREDQKLKAFLNFKASGRPLGLLETLLKTNKNCLKLSLRGLRTCG